MAVYFANVNIKTSATCNRRSKFVISADFVFEKYIIGSHYKAQQCRQNWNQYALDILENVQKIAAAT